MADCKSELLKLAVLLREQAAASRDIVAIRGRLHPENLPFGDLLRERQELIEVHKQAAKNSEALAELLEVIAAELHGRHHT